MNAPDAITLPDRVEYRNAGGDTTEYRVRPVQMRLRRMRNEVLAAAGVGPGQCHPDDPDIVAHRIDFIAQHESGATPAVATRIAVLHDEIRDHAMPARAVEVAALDEIEKRR